MCLAYWCLFVGLAVDLHGGLPSFIRLAEVINIAFAMVVVFTRNDGVHASRFTFERHGCRGISSTALDGLDLKSKLVALFPST